MTGSRTKATALSGGPTPSALPAERSHGESATARIICRLGPLRIRLRGEVTEDTYYERVCRERDDLRAALLASIVAIDDWLHCYAPEMCGAEYVKATTARLRESGGTLAYIADVQQANRAAVEGRESGLAGPTARPLPNTAAGKHQKARRKTKSSNRGTP